MEEVFPRVVFYIFGLPVRNTVVSTWVTMVVIIGLVWLLRKKLPDLLVMVIEFLRSQISDVIDGHSPDPYIPFLGTLFIFLLIANNISVVPVVVAPTLDINVPLAAAILVFFAVHYFGLREKGVGPYLKEQLSPMIVLDIIGQVSRTMSLSLRLFGNILATEIIVAVIYRLVGPVAPLPMIVLGLVTGVLQAYIFLVLAISAIAAAVRARAVA
jgi:F-type H+-transporting ATPase subunit a